jgi:hypothetical protein
MKWAPSRDATGRERWGVVIFALFFMGLFAAELARHFSPVKLSVPFMLLYIVPLTALHEAGHAVVSHLLGWKVCRIVVGYGRPVLRVRVRDVPVDVRIWPLGGHVLVAPRALHRPRLESAAIYAAGLGAEVALAALVTAAVGIERMLQRTDSIALISAQALVVLVLVDLFSNLVPLPVESERGEALTDGLGIVLSPFLPRSHFVSLMALPWSERAARAASRERRISIYREGVAALPDNPFLRLRLADELFDAGELFEAREERLRALESPELPDALRRKLKEQLGQ